MKLLPVTVEALTGMTWASLPPSTVRVKLQLPLSPKLSDSVPLAL